jgi:hypothetical protein
MDFKFLYHRIRNLILRPERAWRIIFTENRPVRDIRGSYFFPLITLIGISALLGSLFFTHGGLSLFYPLFLGVRYFLAFLISTYFSAIILNEITNALDLGKDFVRSFKLIAYSLAPLYICQIISLLFESLLFINLLSVYSLYIFWLGMEKMINPPEHKKTPLTIATWVSFVAVFGATNWLLRTILDGVYFTIFG